MTTLPHKAVFWSDAVMPFSLCHLLIRHSLPATLTRPLGRRLGFTDAAPSDALHLLRVKLAHVAGADGVVGLGVPLLAAKAVLFVLHLPLPIGFQPAAPGSRIRVVALELLIDGHIEDVAFVGVEVGGASILPFCEEKLDK